MSIGTSPLVDFVLCGGLGVAAVGTLLATFLAVHTVDSSHVASSLKGALKVFVFLLASGAQLAIVTFIGETKSVRDANSLLGFVAGAVVVVVLAILLRRMQSGK